MPQYKVNQFFQQGKYGWSETWYRTDPTIEEALTRAIELHTLRTGLLGHTENGNSPYWMASRVSDVAIQRDSLLYQTPGNGLTGKWDVLHEFAADHPEVALLIRAESSASYRRSVWMRGIPDKLWVDEGFVPDPVWKLRFAAFENVLEQKQWAIRVIDKLLLPIRVFEIFKPVDNGPIRVVFENGAGFVTGDKVRLSGVRNAKHLNREWIINAISGIQVDLVGSNSLALPLPYLGGATVKKQSIILTPVEKLIIREVRTRECGIPFGSPVGRRRPRVLAAL